MNLSFPYLLIAISVLALLSLLLALPSVRRRLIGSSNLRNALIPVVTAGLLWVTASSADVLKGRIEENTIPDDVLSLHIQDVEFGIPPIPTEYREHDYSFKQVKEALAPLNASDNKLNLTDDEIERLNAIARRSGMVEPIDKNQSCTTKDVANAVAGPLAFTFNYTDWSKVSLAWANILDGSRATDDKNGALSKFVDAVQMQLTAAGLFQSIVGMAHRQMMVIPDGAGDCLEAPNMMVRLEENEGVNYLMFPTFRSHLCRANDSLGRTQAAKKFAHLFELSCVESLSAVFRKASTCFQDEADLMNKFVDEWNRILASRQPETIRIKVSISNVGRFDSFVRPVAKISVGPIGASEPLVFTVTKLSSKSSNAEEESDTSPDTSDGFVHVESRSSVIVTFYSRLSTDLQKRLYGAYRSEQAHLRLGVLASAGSSESPILSQIAPFSSNAQTAFQKMVEDMAVPIAR